MQFMKMSYKGFDFDVNPKSIKLQMGKTIAHSTIPGGCDRCDEISHKPAVISGEGYFVGENAMEQAHRLLHIFNLKGSDYLFIPDATPVKAYFTALELCYSGGDNRVSYSFEFKQELQNANEEYSFGYTLARADENMFDVANRTGVAVEKLVASNDYGDLFALKQGDKVWLM